MYADRVATVPACRRQDRGRHEDRPLQVPVAQAQRRPRALQVRSIDAAFLAALQPGAFEGHVHSVFQRVVNLERSSGQLFTLAARGMDNAPCTAIVDIPEFGSAGVAVGDRVVAADGALQVGERLVLNVEPASVWQARLPRYDEAPEHSKREKLRLARAHVAHWRRTGSVDGGPDGAFAVEVARALGQRSARLITALAEQRHGDALQHAVSMLGLGPGLTPSGDDFLVGLFAVLNLAGSPCYGWLEGGKAVLGHAQGATNAISMAALSAAADGRVRESIGALIHALLVGTNATLARCLQRVLAIGATSGIDLAEGVLAGIELNLHVEATRAREQNDRAVGPP